ncbi:unnamed protein product [Brachionus calyciflorus]|uniref:Pre-mRNA-splicing factor CWC25 n=1 Tax=Brachionus calyciflorus TaxID=104777 RepID=A0A814DNJ0_9BILA|nr:unnamed protein product [Brachionus calyciflorus]
MQTIDPAERTKIAKLHTEMKQDSDKKMEWLYTGDKIDRDAYLLGKPINKLLIEKEQEKPKENEFLPSTIDLANKIREDPLFEIKKREIEAKKKILENPLKLKQLKQMISRSSENESDGDSSDSESRRSKKDKKKHKKSKKKNKKSKYSDDSDNSDFERRRKKRRSKSRSRSRSRSRSKNRDKNRDRDRNRERSRSRERNESRPGYGLQRSRNDRSRDRDRSKDRQSHKSKSQLEVEEYKNRIKKLETIRKTGESDYKPEKRGNTKLTDEEKQRKLREMEENAKWRDEVRNKNIKNYKFDEKKEEELQSKDKSARMQAEAASLFNSMMTEAYSSKEDRIKRNVKNLQKKSSALD